MVANNWFKSSDELCPVVRYSVETSGDGVYFSSYRGSTIIIRNLVDVIVDTAAPLTMEIFIKAETGRGVVQRQKVLLTVCGNENVKVGLNQKQISYNDETELTIDFETIKSTFVSDNLKCPVTTFGIVEKEGYPFSLSLFQNAIVMFRDVKSGNYVLKFDYVSMYDRFDSAVMFLLAARTESNVFGYQKIILLKLGCETKQVWADQSILLQYEYNETSEFFIPKQAYIS